MKEIGSEFWLENNLDTDYEITIDERSILDGILNIGDDQRLLFTGRTAIDFVLDDISVPVKKVFMPSYCCESMLQPFIDRSIDIDFYSVVPDSKGIKYIIDNYKNVDIFFAVSYFGYTSSIMDSILDVFKKRNVIVIEDITHRLLSQQNHCERADYLIGSLRKWFALPSGGVAIKMEGSFKDNYTISPPNSLIDKKINAMINKAEYITSKNSEDEFQSTLKDNFLKLYSEFNLKLKNNYKNIRIDDLSKRLLIEIDVKDIKKKRRQNAELLYTELKESKYTRFLFNEVDFNMDCPLFVPLMVDASMRESLKQHLIKNDIFCPIHWPIPLRHHLNADTEKLYKEELSLVCDQRYDKEDMKRIIKVMEEFGDSYA